MYEISMNNEVCVLFKMGIGKNFISFWKNFSKYQLILIFWWVL